MKAKMGVSLVVGELVGRDIVVADILDPSPLHAHTIYPYQLPHFHYSKFVR